MTKICPAKARLYGQLGRRMDQLAAEFSRTHDAKIKAEILALTTRRLKMVEKGEAVETELLHKKTLQ